MPDVYICKNSQGYAKYSHMGKFVQQTEKGPPMESGMHDPCEVHVILLVLNCIQH